MVEFTNITGMRPSGPCRRIMRRRGDVVRDMVERTAQSANEYATHFVEIDGNMGNTKIKEGTESAMSKRTMAMSRMDAMSLSSELKETPGRPNVNDYLLHSVHTHPEGHTGMSLRDLQSFADRATTDGLPTDSSLVATMTMDGIMLAGAYIDDETDTEMLKRVEGVATSPDRMANRRQKEERIVEIMEEPVRKACITFGFVTKSTNPLLLCSLHHSAPSLIFPIALFCHLLASVASFALSRYFGMNLSISSTT